MARVAGTVIEVRGDRAWVECRSEPVSCGACATGRGCTWRAPATQRRLAVPAELAGRPLQTGEVIELEADDTNLFQAALRLYLPPLVGLLAGPALVRWIGWEHGSIPLVAAIAGLLLGCLVARAWTQAAPAFVLHRP